MQSILQQRKQLKPRVEMAIFVTSNAFLIKMHADLTDAIKGLTYTAAFLWMV